jgi:hypothetical protein
MLTKEMLDVLKKFPFYNDFANHKMSHDVFIENLDAFASQLRKLGFSQEDIKSVKKGTSYRFILTTKYLHFEFLKNNSAQSVKKMFSPTNMWVSHFTSYGNLLTIIKSKNLQDPFGVTAKHNKISSYRHEQNMVLRRFLDGISFDLSSFHHSVYSDGEPILLLIPLHKCLRPGLVLDFKDVMDGYPEINLRYEGIYDNGLNNSQFTLLFHLNKLRLDLERHLVVLPTAKKSYALFQRDYVKISALYNRALDFSPKRLEQEHFFRKNLSSITNFFQDSIINPSDIFSVLSLCQNRKSVSFLCFFWLFGSSQLYNYLNGEKPTVYSTYGKRESIILSDLLRKTPYLRSAQSFYNMNLTDSFSYLYFLYNEPMVYSNLGITKHKEILSLSSDDFKKLLTFAHKTIQLYYKILYRQITKLKYNKISLKDAILIVPAQLGAYLHGNNLTKIFSEVITYSGTGKKPSDFTDGVKTFAFSDHIYISSFNELLLNSLGLNPILDEHKIRKLFHTSGYFYGEYGLFGRIKKLMFHRRDNNQDMTISNL